MKRNYLFGLLLVLTSTSMFAQDIVLFEQIISGDSGIVSDVETTGDEQAAWSVDDFEVADGGTINTITVQGFSSNAANFLNGYQGIELYIFDNDSGIPSGFPTVDNSWLLKLDVAVDETGLTVNQTPLPEGPGAEFEYVFDLIELNGSGFVAQPGTKYWISVAAKVNFSITAAGNARWNWYNAGVFGEEAHLTFLNGAFGQPEGTYTPFSALQLSFFDVAMKLEGTTSLSNNDFVKDAFSIYPNPVQDVINITTKGNESIKQVQLLDVQGKEINVSLNNNQVDVSNLASGMYFIYVETEAGRNALKFVKN